MLTSIIQQAKERQLELAVKVNLSAFTGKVDLIAGADISFNLKEDIVYAAIVVLDMQTLTPLEKASAVEKVSFPYVPGYLSFREVPPLLAAWRKLKLKPPIVMLDGHGIIHPRRFGLACHFGLEAGVATLGCAKKPFVGVYKEPGLGKYDVSDVVVEGEHRGFAYRSRARVKPVYISPGTGMSLEDSLQYATMATGKYRLLEPTRQAHICANELRRA